VHRNAAKCVLVVRPRCDQGATKLFCCRLLPCRELVLRFFAMWRSRNNFSTPMWKFLNAVSAHE